MSAPDTSIRTPYEENYHRVVRELAANDMRVAGWMKNVLTPKDFKSAFLQALETEKPND